MKLKSLELINFRQFYGEQKLIFSTDPNKNISLIHAENGTGKTALLNAILWCFFEDVTSNFKDPSALINKVAKIEGKTTCGVKIEFEDDNGTNYLVQRFDRNGQRSFKVHRFLNNSYDEVDSPSSFINSVIPRDMAKYFFFQGEGIGKMSGAKGGNLVKAAVKEILGFTVAEQALSDIKQIKREYQKSLSNADKSGKLHSLQARLEDLEDRIESIKKQRNDSEEAIAVYSKKLEQIDQALKNSDSNVIKSLHKNRENLEYSLRREKELLAVSQQSKKGLIAEYSTTVFGFQLSKSALDFIDESSYKGTLPAPYNEQLVQDILNEAKCICGSDVKPGTEAFDRINAMLGKAGDPMLENRIRKARSQLTSIKIQSRKAASVLNTTLKTIADAEGNISKLTKQLEEISQQIKGAADIEKIRLLEEERVRINNNLAQEHRAVGAKKTELERDKRELDQLKSEIGKLDAFSSEMKKFKALVEYCENVEHALQDTLTAAESDVESRLIHKVNKYLTQFVRQDYKAKINPSTFDIRLIDNNNSLVAESDGQALLLNLTFISSLIELSRERKSATGQILTPGAIAPFVIDAPFGDLDNKYKGNVASTIPNSVEQVVLLLSSSHWQGQVESSIRDKVGVEYNLALEVTSDGDQKEEDYIEINNKKYETVRYNQPTERTVIEKVGYYV